MFTDQTTRPTVTGAEIHPEIPMPHWTTERYLDDDGRVVMDAATFDEGAFFITANLLHAITAEGVETSVDNILLNWENMWPDGVDQEQCVVLVDTIPALITALQNAYDAMTRAPRVVRRSAAVADALQGREN